MTFKQVLVDYYSKASKHSNYQELPGSLKKLIGSTAVETKSRYEKERLAYILKNISVGGRCVLDIGSNTGFFAFELIDAGAERVTCYEGNKEHAKFIKLAAQALGLTNIEVVNQYYQFDGSDSDKYDLVLLLNVLHHIGDDYGKRGLSVNDAKRLITEQLNSLSGVTDAIIFQLGFNWQGDVKRPLFSKGTKRELIDFIRTGIKDCWDIEAIGIAEKTSGAIRYNDLDAKNIGRDDALGEFLNRPLFVLKAKKG